MYIEHPTFAFYIIHFGSESNTFGDLGKSFLKVFVMIHGEFEFEALWKDSADRLEKKPLVKVFTMLLLVGLCLCGSLIMVSEKVPVLLDLHCKHYLSQLNLIVAVIITDISQLHQEAKDQALVNQVGQLGVQVLTKFQEFHLFFCMFALFNSHKGVL